MRKQSLFAGSLLFILSLGLVAELVSETNNSGGKFGYSGAPGSGTCNNCHIGEALNAAPGKIMVESDIPASGYKPNTTYNVTVKVVYPGRQLFGFNFKTTNGSLEAVNPSAVSISGDKSEATHRRGAPPAVDTGKFELKWTAPAAGSGDAQIYVAGIAANGNGSNSGDNVYTTNLTVKEAELTTDKDDWLVDTQKLKIYPNPASNYCIVDFKTTGATEIILTNLQGKSVRVWEGVGNGTRIQHTIDLSNLAKGIYLLSVRQGNSHQRAHLRVH
jgi:hypothetical protein